MSQSKRGPFGRKVKLTLEQLMALSGRPFSMSHIDQEEQQHKDDIERRTRGAKRKATTQPDETPPNTNEEEDGQKRLKLETTRKSPRKHANTLALEAEASIDLDHDRPDYEEEKLPDIRKSSRLSQIHPVIHAMAAIAPKPTKRTATAEKPIAQRRSPRHKRRSGRVHIPTKIFDPSSDTDDDDVIAHKPARKPRGVFTPTTESSDDDDAVMIMYPAAASSASVSLVIHPHEEIKVAADPLPPSSGSEIETLSDWPGFGCIYACDKTSIATRQLIHPDNLYRSEIVAGKRQYFKDAYDLQVFETADKNINVTIDYNTDSGGDKRRAGLEFVGVPTTLGDRTYNKQRAELSHMTEHFNNWVADKRNTFREELKDQSGRVSERRKFHIDLEEWCDAYNADPITKRKHYSELIMAIPEQYRDDHFTWKMELEAIDLAPRVEACYYPQLNVTIPAEKMCSPEMRAIAGPSTRLRDYTIVRHEKQPVSSDFHTMKPRTDFLVYEEEVYGKSLELADNCFKAHFRPDQTRIQGFIRTLSYVMALTSTPLDKLEELFSDGRTNKEAAQIAVTLVKDIFPKGMPKFTLKQFYDHMLEDEDRAALSDKERVVKSLFNRAVAISTDPHDNESFYYNPEIVNADSFCEYLFRGRKDETLREECSPDPVPHYLSKLITPQHGCGVVEFRDLGAKSHSLQQCRTVIEQAEARYVTMFGQNSQGSFIR